MDTTVKRVPIDLTAWNRKIPEFPKDFVVIVDTREQIPFFKKSPKGLTIVRDTLKNGDYSLRGFEGKIAIERKRISDLMGYIGSEHKRTVEKLQRLRNYEFKALVIESEYDELFQPQYHSFVSPESVRGALAAWEVRYDLHIFTHPNTEECSWWVLDRLLFFYKYKRSTEVR
jgi:ERCC4-type nuclease